jgi:DNA-binding transcriptional ArsR family regulator
MKDELSNTSASASLAAATSALGMPADVPNVFANPCLLLKAVSDPVRWNILRELISSAPLSVQELAVRVGGKPSQMSKHLALLRAAGALTVVSAPDGDGRKAHHAVPENCRRTEAGRPVIDYGVCVLRFP